MKDIQKEIVLACKKDLEARGVQVEGRAIVPVDFYEQMMKLIMDERNRIFTF
jgi:sulfur transfer complex TusBCD TusB component (DsrH family)